MSEIFCEVDVLKLMRTKHDTLNNNPLNLTDKYCQQLEDIAEATR